MLQKSLELERLGAALGDAGRASAEGTAALQRRVEELTAENERLWSQYQLGQVERLASQKQARRGQKGRWGSGVVM